MTETCRIARERLDDALDGRLDPGALAAFEAHVRACGACAAEWDLARSLRRSLLRIGLEPAPAGLRESIAAEVGRVAAARRAPVRQVAAASSRLSSWRSWRAAAAVLLIVTVGWLSWEAWDTSTPEAGRFQAPPAAGAPPSAGPPMARVQAEAADELSPQGKAEPHGGARPAEVDVVWNAELLPGIRDPGLVIAADDETAVALSNARRIAEGGPGADEDLNRVVTARATPEVRRRQAEVLTLLGDHLAELAEVAGDAAALSRLGADADATLLAFSPPDAGLAKTGAAAGNEEQPDDQDAMKESARKVVRAPAPAESAPAAPAGRAYRDEPRRGSEPAFYVVSGPGAIARVERNLAAQNLAFHRVWLTDRPDDDRQRRLEDAAAEYRILEVEVPEAAFDATIGELESLAGLRLAPVGAVRPDASAAPAGRGAGRGGHKAAPLRKLRLVLIPR